MLSENFRANLVSIEDEMDSKRNMLRELQGDEAGKLRKDNMNRTSITMHNGGKLKLTCVVISFNIRRTNKETSRKYQKLP